MFSCGNGDSDHRLYNPAKVAFEASYNPIFDGCLYPSLVLALSGSNNADLIGNGQLFTVSLTAPANGSVLRVVLDSSQLNYVTIMQEELPKKGVRYTFHPMVKWKYDQLYATRKQGVVDLSFSCYINDELVDVETLRINYRSANECLLKLEDTNGRPYDIRWVFAGYVNEDHPFIDSILSRVLERGIVSRFEGYQRNAKMVQDQVFAFWYDALEQGIAYSSISCTSNPSRRSNVQHIRFFDEVYRSRQANCIDACVFFASLLRKIGLKPVIFVEPCHAYLGYYADKNRKKVNLLETTITAWVNFPELNRSVDANGRLPQQYYNKVKRFLSEEDQTRYQAGKMTFSELKLAVARTLFEKASVYNQDNYNANKKYFDDKDNSSYQMLDIELLRKSVQPIN
ncbi:MAG: hypothetical protein KBT04_01705 [Bacteroidales bacterium]|nr:hypothetical protein [Candidatus Colimorpha onthohippi]